ncbi:hypothetical protein Lesp02_41930 [Lentzea sp. NBRC 105346]|uniref:hypothetical protein n=1 Tax=Lentzea sp. NBRC 105346 TaxID=3032205 RepID=UPI0024A1FF06|nr:hypothetical protein [Lentzea sp. NBRC 105346]GLZ32005.1 hypothetical protein Lesp02_41930 [Lentzea sp. NBRC 105346]
MLSPCWRDLNAALDLEAKQVVAVGIGGAGNHPDGGIELKVGKDSKTSHTRKVTSGHVALVGGIQLTKDKVKVAISNVRVDIKSGAVTAKVGAEAGVRIGRVSEPGTAEAVKQAGTTNLMLVLGSQGITPARER